MTKVVINLCGVKSKGGVTVFNNYLEQNKTKNLYVLYDNLEFKKYIENFDNQYITTKRIYHPFLNLLLSFFAIVLLRGETKIFFIFKLDLKIPKMVEYVMCPVPKKPIFINYAE